MKYATKPVKTPLAAFTALMCSAAFSQEAANPESAPKVDGEITVYATRSPQPLFNVPLMVSKIEADAAGTALAGDIGDLVEFTAGVEVAGGVRRNGQTLAIRGYDDDAVITLTDGRRQNFASTHDGRFFIDNSLLKSVELVKGASSSIYGGGAIGGVVAFETKDAADLLASGRTAGALFSSGGRSASEESLLTGSFFGSGGGWDLLGSVSLRESGDIRQGGGGRINADDRIGSTLLKAAYRLNDRSSLAFQAQLFNGEGREPNNPGSGTGISNPIVDKELTDNQFSLKYTYRSQSGWLNPSLHLYANNTEVQETDRDYGCETDRSGALVCGTTEVEQAHLFACNAANPNCRARRVQSRDLATLGLTLDNQTVFSSGRVGHILSYGLEVYNDRQTGNRFFRPAEDIAARTPDGLRDGVPTAEAMNHGFYLQDEISIDTSFGEFLLIAAARFDSYESEDGSGGSQNESAASPKLSVSYWPDQNIMLFGSWARAFRAPDLTELYAAGVHFPGFPVVDETGRPVIVRGRPLFFPDNRFVTNTALKPETVTTVELGLALDFDDALSFDDRLRIKAAVFSSDGEGFISSQVNVRAGTTRRFNVPEAELLGAEMELRYNRHRLSAGLGVSYVEAENARTGEYLSNNVPLTLVADISYRFDAVGGVLGWRGRRAADNDKVFSTDMPTEGYTVHDIYYRWRPRGVSSLILDMGIENVLDKRYRKRFTGDLYEEGVSYTARLSYQW